MKLLEKYNRNDPGYKKIEIDEENGRKLHIYPAILFIIKLESISNFLFLYVL